MKELYKALAKVHESLENPKRTKEVTIKHKTGGSHKLKYAPLDELINISRKLLAENGIALMQSVEPDNGKDYLCTKLTHVSGESVTTKLPFGTVPGDPKDYGARLTYIKRYGMCAALNISAEDDNDAPAKMTGKLNSSKLRSDIAKFANGISDCDTSQDLMARWNEYRDAIEQAKIDMPDLLKGMTKEGTICVEDLYRNTMNALIGMEKQEKANQESFRETVRFKPPATGDEQ